VTVKQPQNIISTKQKVAHTCSTCDTKNYHKILTATNKKTNKQNKTYGIGWSLAWLVTFPKHPDGPATIQGAGVDKPTLLQHHTYITIR
jgi:hypothetical protein